MGAPRGFTLLELLIVAAVIAIIMSIATPIYFHSRIRAQETSAVASLRSINQSQWAFSQTCGRQRYAPSLTSLAKMNPATNEVYLSPDLTAADEVVKSGYRIAMDGTEVEEPLRTCTGDIPVVSYQVTAEPVLPGRSGNLFFGTNIDGAIYENAESFAGKMPESGPPTLGQEIRGIARNP